MVDEKQVHGMITNGDFQEFEKNLIRDEGLDIERNFRIAEALYAEAISLGVLPLKDPLEGIEVDIWLAKVINSVPRSP
jgi:hypothetical protein